MAIAEDYVFSPISLLGDDSQAAITMSVLLILVSNSAAAIIVLL